MESPLKWHGGKHYLAHKIVDLMPYHLHYVEPFCGSAAVLLARDPDKNWYGEGMPKYVRGCSEVVNDIHNQLMNFWWCLQDKKAFEEFLRLVNVTPFSETEWNDAIDCAPTHFCDVKAAVKFFIRCRQSRAAQFREFATISRSRTRRNMNEQVSAWLTRIEGLPEIHNRLKRVVILNRPALETIRTQDGPKTLFYCDPPYLHETRTNPSVYTHEMSTIDHRRLLETLLLVEGKVMLSGYYNDLYNEMLKGWQRYHFDMPNNVSQADTKDRRIECLWCNFG